jgi:hypothetical protein
MVPSIELVGADRCVARRESAPWRSLRLVRMPARRGVRFNRRFSLLAQLV